MERSWQLAKEQYFTIPVAKPTCNFCSLFLLIHSVFFIFFIVFLKII